MIRIKNLTVQYGERVIIDNQNISFENGKVTIIKGESGAGKSSLLNVIGLLKTSNKECKYYYQDKQIKSGNEKENAIFRLNHIGFIFQQGNLLNNLTALENVKLPIMMHNKDVKQAEELADKWLEFVGLENVKGSYPQDLSGGEEQRVCIARALVNDCDIILADEPTASLDAVNAENVLNLLKRLAHEMNKIVIIVSHDKKVLEYGDKIYEINNKQINEIYNNTKALKGMKKKNEDKKTILSFIKNYEKMRRQEKKISFILIAVSALIVAIASMSFEFSDAFVNNQKQFLNAISDRSLLVINDTMGLNATSDYDEALSFKEKEISTIKTIPNVESVYPYYEFTSYGIAKDIKEKSDIKIYQNGTLIVEKQYENEYMADGNEFKIVPIYPAEDISSYIKEGNKTADGVYISEKLANELGITQLNAHTMEISCYVPSKLYISSAMLNQQNNKEVSIDGCISKLVTIKTNIKGIINNSYTYDKTENNGMLIFMNYNDMDKIIDNNKGNMLVRDFKDFEEKELAPSMLVVFAANYDDVSSIEEKINQINTTVSTVNRASDIEVINTNLKSVKNMVISIAGCLVVIVTIMFGFIYYFRNRERKKEIGILKALGLDKNDVYKLMLYNLIKNTLITFVLSIVLSYILQNVIFAIMGIQLMKVTISSVLLAFFMSVVVIVASSMASIVKTGKIDVIDAIRYNK